MASEGDSLLINEAPEWVAVGASVGLVLTAGEPLATLETQRTFIGVARRLTRRPAAPPILKRDIVWVEEEGGEWRVKCSDGRRGPSQTAQVTVSPKAV